MNGGPASTSGIFLRGTNSNQTLVLDRRPARGLLDVGHRGAGGDPARIDRPYRDPARARIEPLWRRRDRRRDPAVHPQRRRSLRRTRQRRLRHLPQQRRVGRHFRCRRTPGGTRSTPGTAQSAGFNAISNPANFSFNDDRDGYRDDHFSGSVSYRFAPEQELSAQFLNSHLNAQFDAEPGFDDRTITTLDSYALASRNRVDALVDQQPRSRPNRGQQATRKPDSGRDGSRRGSASMLGRTISLLPRGARRPRARAPRGARRRRRRVRGDVAQHQRGVRRLSPRRRTAGRAGQSAPRRQRAIRRPHDRRARLRLRLRSRLARQRELWHRLQGADLQRPLLSRVFQSRPCSPRRRAMARSRFATLRTPSTPASSPTATASRDLIVFACDADFNCAPQNVAAATLQGIDARLRAFAAAQRPRPPSVDLHRPQDDASGFLLPRRARRHRRAQPSLHPFGPVQFECRVERVVGALRRRREHASDGRLCVAQSAARMAVRTALDGVRATRQCAGQALRARRRLPHRRREPVRRCALALLRPDLLAECGLAFCAGAGDRCWKSCRPDRSDRRDRRDGHAGRAGAAHRQPGAARDRAAVRRRRGRPRRRRDRSGRTGRPRPRIAARRRRARARSRAHRRASRPDLAVAWPYVAPAQIDAAPGARHSDLSHRSAHARGIAAGHRAARRACGHGATSRAPPRALPFAARGAAPARARCKRGPRVLRDLAPAAVHHRRRASDQRGDRALRRRERFCRAVAAGAVGQRRSGPCGAARRPSSPEPTARCVRHGSTSGADGPIFRRCAPATCSSSTPICCIAPVRASSMASRRFARRIDRARANVAH